MARGLSYFVEVVMLAPGAQTLLRRTSAHVLAPLDTEEDVFKLIHARVSEQQRGIVSGQKGTGTHPRVAVTLEVLQKLFANLVTPPDPTQSSRREPVGAPWERVRVV